MFITVIEALTQWGVDSPELQAAIEEGKRRSEVKSAFARNYFNESGRIEPLGAHLPIRGRLDAIAEATSADLPV